jgi:hypothetical protein
MQRSSNALGDIAAALVGGVGGGADRGGGSSSNGGGDSQIFADLWADINHSSRGALLHSQLYWNRYSLELTGRVQLGSICTGIVTVLS